MNSRTQHVFNSSHLAHHIVLFCAADTVMLMVLTNHLPISLHTYRNTQLHRNYRTRTFTA